MSSETDLKYLRRDIDKLEKSITTELAEIKATLSVMQDGYVRKNDYRTALHDINIEIKDIRESKADKEDLKLTQSNLSRVNWIVLTAVIGAILSTVVIKVI